MQTVVFLAKSAWANPFNSMVQNILCLSYLISILKGKYAVLTYIILVVVYLSFKKKCFKETVSLNSSPVSIFFYSFIIACVFSPFKRIT